MILVYLTKWWTDYCHQCKICRLLPMFVLCVVRLCAHISEYDEDDYMKNKSVNLRSKWIQKRLHGVIKSEHIKTISTDFMKIVHTMNKNKLIKGSKRSRHNCYIIRLCSRRGIKLLKSINSMKDLETRKGFVYKALKWDTNCKCLHYKEWCDRR